MNDQEQALADRIYAATVTDENGCRIWQRGCNNGGKYGRIWNPLEQRSMLTHRVVWTLEHGPIPDGMTVDHTCHVTLCQNVLHLRLLTNPENAQDGSNRSPAVLAQRAKTHCPTGHPYDEINTRLYRGRRYCRTCQAARNRKQVQV